MAAPKVEKKKQAVAKKTSIKKPVTKKAVAKKKTVSKAQQEKPRDDKPAKVKNSSSLVLNASVVINDVKSLHEDLIRLSNSKEAVTLDASEVEMIDTAAFQLLLAFVSTMNTKNISVIWKDPSDVFLERATILDLTDILCLVKA